MTRIFIRGLAVVLLAICLISGGCSSLKENSNIKAWKELIDFSPKKNDTETENPQKDLLPVSPDECEATVVIDLYFVGPDGENLQVEKRTVGKTEGIARCAIEELTKGPKTAEYLSVLPKDTRILDINIKPDGLCIVDMSSEIRKVNNAHQEELIVYAIANTLGQFQSVEKVLFMINGQEAKSIGGFIDISYPIEPDVGI